jgi:peroxiredoxin
MSLTPGSRLELGQVYKIDEQGIHSKFPIASLFTERNIVFGGPAPFSRLDTEQAITFEKASAEFLDNKINKIMGIYCQDAFVMKQFQTHVRDNAGSDNVIFYGDGDGFFIRNYGLEYDFTYQGLSVRSRRWAAVIHDCVIEHIEYDEFQIIENTAPERLLAWLKENNET